MNKAKTKTLDMVFNRALGDRLRMLRQIRRMTQQALADALGVTFQQVQKYETGMNRVPPERIAACARIFSVPIGYFFGQETTETKKYVIQHDKRIMTIAAAIAAIPSEKIVKQVYYLALAIGEDLSERRGTETNQNIPPCEKEV